MSFRDEQEAQRARLEALEAELASAKEDLARQGPADKRLEQLASELEDARATIDALQDELAETQRLSPLPPEPPPSPVDLHPVVPAPRKQWPVVTPALCLFVWVAIVIMGVFIESRRGSIFGHPNAMTAPVSSPYSVTPYR